MKSYICKIFFIGIATMTLLFSSCASDTLDHKVDFIGDSLIARWDVQQAFPSRLVRNAGIGGSGIQLLENNAGAFGTADVVVLSGTNDNSHFTQADRIDYANRFIDAVLKLTSGRIFVFSVLPRDFQGDRANLNSDIKAYNEVLKNKLGAQPRVVFFDVYPDFIDGESINLRYYSDGLHLNDAGYEILNSYLRSAL